MTDSKPKDFTRFYFEMVATGEGCGCAERVIDVHEFNRLAGKPRRLRRPAFPTPARLRLMLLKAGLWPRPNSRED